MVRAALPAGPGREAGAAREASPPGVNVRTRVHEYGGGEYTVWRDRLYYVDDADRHVLLNSDDLELARSAVSYLLTGVVPPPGDGAPPVP